MASLSIDRTQRLLPLGSACTILPVLSRTRSRPLADQEDEVPEETVLQRVNDNRPKSPRLYLNAS